MATLGHQKIDTLTLTGLSALIAAVAVVSALAPGIMPWSFLAPAAAAVLLYWAVKWEMTVWAWLWVFSYGLLEWPTWRLPVAGLFKLSVPRLIFLGALATFFLHYLLRRGRFRLDRALFWVMLALLAYCAASATATGWRARTPQVQSAPYFRFLGAMLLPYLMFLLIYNTARDERQILWAGGSFVVYGWYALYVGYLQYASITWWGGARAWIWPAYINDPTYGIHFDRARGAFAGAAPQAALLVLLFYVDLFLARHTRGWVRAVCWLQAAAVPPAIFFTGLRSAYVAFLLCGVVWIVVAGRRRFRWAKLATAALAVFIATAVFWSNLTQTTRRRGGVAQRGPVVARMILVRQTWHMIKQHPVTGVGFGHFVDAQMRLQRDPASLAGMSTGVLVEHNLFLNMVAETGVIGLTLTLAVFVMLFRQSRQLYRKLPAKPAGPLSRSFVALFWVALTAYLTDAMFRDPLWDVFSNGMLWCLAGLVVGYNAIVQPPAAAEPDTC